MSAQAIRWESWALSEEADRRFQRIVLFVSVPALILAMLLSFIHMQARKTETGSYNPARYVELVAEQPVPAPPPEPPKPVEENQPEKPQQAAPPKPVEKPAPPPVPQPSARELAEKTQEMKEIQDQLQDLRDQSLNNLGDQPLVSSTITSKGGVGAAEAIAQSAAANSGNGISGTASVTSTQSGTGLGTRRTSQVHSNLGTPGKLDANGKLDSGGRTIDEIAQVFDRYKGSLNAIYMGMARKDPSIDVGDMIVSLVIAPDGSVTQCSIVSSTFNSPEFEEKVVLRIKSINFGAKNGPPFDVPHYPIHWQPM